MITKSMGSVSSFSFDTQHKLTRVKKQAPVLQREHDKATRQVEAEKLPTLKANSVLQCRTQDKPTTTHNRMDAELAGKDRCLSLFDLDRFRL
jgi:hypothetical protein